MQYIDKIRLASALCCGIYGNTSKLDYVMQGCIGPHGHEFDIMFRDVLSEGGYLIINHDTLEYNKGLMSLSDDRNHSRYAIMQDHILVRHRHRDCPNIGIIHNSLHILEYDGQCVNFEPYIMEMAVKILNHIMNIDVLNRRALSKVNRFLTLPSAFEEMAVRGAENYIKYVE